MELTDRQTMWRMVLHIRISMWIHVLFFCNNSVVISEERYKDDADRGEEEES